MHNQNYSYRVAWDAEDDCYIAISPEFPGISAFGDTAEEALSEFATVVETTIEIYQEEGWDLPKPQFIPEYSGQFRLRLPKGLHARLADRAKDEGVSLNTLVVQYISEGLINSGANIQTERIVQPVMNLLSRVEDMYNNLPVVKVFSNTTPWTTYTVNSSRRTGTKPKIIRVTPQ